LSCRLGKATAVFLVVHIILILELSPSNCHALTQVTWRRLRSAPLVIEYQLLIFVFVFVWAEAFVTDACRFEGGNDGSDHVGAEIKLFFLRGRRSRLLRGRLFDGWSRIGRRNACHESDEVFGAGWFFDVGLRGLESSDLSARGKSAVCVPVSAGSV
jgi:hypothetical protein